MQLSYRLPKLFTQHFFKIAFEIEVLSLVSSKDTIWIICYEIMRDKSDILEGKWTGKMKLVEKAHADYIDILSFLFVLFCFKA